MSFTHKFEVGDWVIFESGSYSLTVTHVWEDGKVDLKYNHSSKTLTRYRTDRLQPYDPEQAYDAFPKSHYIATTQKVTSNKETDMSTLYEVTIDNEVRFATRLAVNSQGQWVMEEKGTGAVFTSDKSKVVEVTPYTIGVMFLGSGNQTVYSYNAEVGKYKVGDAFVAKTDYGTNIVVVVGTDTKSKNATKDVSGIILSRILTEDFK